MTDKSIRRKIGIMGGTFNPIHNGHILLAQAALCAETLDEVIFMPSGISYMKADTGVLDAQKRLEMVKLAIEEYPHFTVSDMEIKRLGHTYTHETLTELRKCHPNDTFYFIMGADNLFSIENWKCPEEIFKQCIVLAALRNNTPVSKMQEKIAELNHRFAGDIRLLPFKDTPISSSQIREMFAKGEDTSNILPTKVKKFIEENVLYQ